jgi:hypothetical protein
MPCCGDQCFVRTTRRSEVYRIENFYELIIPIFTAKIEYQSLSDCKITRIYVRALEKNHYASNVASIHQSI